MINVLNNCKYGYHTFCLPEKRHLRTIIKGVLESISVDEIRPAFMKLGFNPIHVERWKRKRGKPIVIVQVVVPREERRIFAVNRLMHQVVKVQTQRSNGRRVQCFNCQIFGHSSANCKATPACVKYAGKHDSHDLEKAVSKLTLDIQSSADRATKTSAPEPFQFNLPREIKELIRYKNRLARRARATLNPEDKRMAPRAIREVRDRDLDLKDSYHVDRTVLTLIGVFPRASYNKFFYATRFAVLFLSMFCYALSMLAYVVIEFTQHLKIIETLLLMISVINSLVKVTNLLCNNKKIAMIENIFENQLLYQMNADQRKEIENVINMTQYVMKYYRCAVFVAWVAYNSFPILDSTDARRLVIPAYFPWSMANLIIYIATYVYQSVMLLISASLNTTVDVLFAMFCTVICQELKILKDHLQNLNYNQHSSRIKSDIKRNVSFHVELIRATEIIEDIFSYGILSQFAASISVICFTGFELILHSSRIKSDIKRNVSFHVELIRATEIIEDIFSYGILSQFAASISVICFTGFELILFSPDTSNYFMLITYGLHLLSYMACMVVQVSIYCSFGHNVMTESSDIGQALYLSNWYMSDLSIRKELLILMERVKRPIILTAGKLFPLTLSTLTMIFRSSYSFFAVLQRTK
ncbi:odorant receptor Or1-like [Rhynchophorus ferrugineus]|uniref:odorant receptor Or1-like n=1 Tax=Rhynchophorus ferrugineus TaxID=354439 RepID=UPI003FCCC31F